MDKNLVVDLLPVLSRPLGLGFNVFDVMHHGMHEKQISNVFRWLLDAHGSHQFGQLFLRVFIDALNDSGQVSPTIPHGDYAIRQEVNTSDSGAAGDIADIVIENSRVSIVVENYEISDGHGHSYEGYTRYSQRDGRRGVVVLLCQRSDKSLQTLGWENAPVLTYTLLIERLWGQLSTNWRYQKKNPDAYSFVQQMHAKFVKGKGQVEQQDVLRFVVAMCHSGEAVRFGQRPIDVAKEQFAADLAEQARERFGEGRELLRVAKHQLRSYAGNELRAQLVESLGEGAVGPVGANWSGIYEWNVVLPVTSQQGRTVRFQLKLGPSAWFENENGKPGDWESTVPATEADYSHLFLGAPERKTIRQSSVSLQELFNGVEPTDRRLHDELLAMLDLDQATS